jgi:hypothetical protein
MFEQAHYQEDEAARELLESIRWPEGPVCPDCGCIGNSTKLTIRRHPGAGVHQCNDCRKQFTVTIGAVYERRPHRAAHLVAGHALDLRKQEGYERPPDAQDAGVSYKTAWFIGFHLIVTVSSRPFSRLVSRHLHDDAQSIFERHQFVVVVSHDANLPSQSRFGPRPDPLRILGHQSRSHLPQNA